MKKLIKTYLWSKISQERLYNLAMLSIKNDMTKTIDSEMILMSRGCHYFLIVPNTSFFLSVRVFNSQTLKIISKVESFLGPNKQGTPAEGRRIQQPKLCEKNNKVEDNSPKTLIKKSSSFDSEI